MCKKGLEDGGRKGKGGGRHITKGHLVSTHMKMNMKT